MLASLHSGALWGIQAQPVQVEVNSGESGAPELVLVGLPDAAVKESRDRVGSALANCAYRTPPTRTTINLAPGSLRKEGPMYDLPIALGLLASTEQMQSKRLDEFLVAGELSLSGQTRPIAGGLALALLARTLGKKGVLLPRESAQEASLVEGVDAYPVDSLGQAVGFLEGRLEIRALTKEESPFRHTPDERHAVDFSEVKGQLGLRRAVEVAVAGGHNLLVIGPPGSGKSMVARRIPTIMPEPTLDEFLEILAIQSAAGVSLDAEYRCYRRPFRTPHHTISDVGLLGGGTIPGPGEISLAHHGVLFLDELPEFRRSALEVMRQPLEDGSVCISRSAGKVSLPCSFMLVAAMNPCPCGYLGDPKHECRCGPTAIQRYRARISGPLLDRIDIHVEAPALRIRELRTDEQGESSAAMRERVVAARAWQAERLKAAARKTGDGASLTVCNARMGPAQLRKHCALSQEQGQLLQQAMEQLDLSARAYDRILKVARTIADLAGSADIATDHLLEAIRYRTLDRRVFY